MRSENRKGDAFQSTAVETGLRPPCEQIFLVENTTRPVLQFDIWNKTVYLKQQLQHLLH